jgi:hypothetical protein
MITTFGMVMPYMELASCHTSGIFEMAPRFMKTLYTPAFEEYLGFSSFNISSTNDKFLNGSGRLFTF